MHRVVITGLGLATSLGPDASYVLGASRFGRKRIRRISFWDPSEYQTKVAGEVRGIPREVGLDSFPEIIAADPVRLFAPVRREAWRDAATDQTPIAGRRCRTVAWD